MSRQLKVSEVTLKNFKAVREGTLHFVNTTFLRGKNGAGKTTVLQLLDFLIAGETGVKIPQMIKEGAAQAEAEITLVDDQGREYNFSWEIKKLKSGKEKITGKVIGPEGRIADPQALLGAYIKPIDIGKFLSNQATEAGRRKNMKEVFEPLLGLDLSGMDLEQKEAEEERKETRRDLKDKMARLDGAGLRWEELAQDLPPEKNTDELNKRLASAYQINSDIQKAEQASAEAEEKIKDAEAKIRSLQEEINKQKGIRVRADNFLAENYPIDPTQVQAEIEEANQYNSRLRVMATYKPDAEKIPNLKERDEELTSKIEALRKQKQELVHAAASSGKMPDILSLRLNEKDQVELWAKDDRGTLVPFHDLQVQKSYQVLLLCWLMAHITKERNFAALPVTDGSLLDPDNMERLIKLCEEYGLQLVVELVPAYEPLSGLVELEREMEY